MATSVSGATKFFPKPQEGFSTTTSGSVSSGGSSVGLSSTGNYSNGDVVVLIIEPGVAGKEQSFTGTIDTGGSQVTGVVWTSGTNSAHSGGVTVVDYVAAAHLHLISSGMLVEHDQDGTHGNITGGTANFSGAVTTDTISEKTAANGVTVDGLNIKDGALNTANSVVEANYTDASIKPEHLVASTGTSWVWQSWTPTWTNLTVGNGVNSSTYTQIGKTVICKLDFTMGTTSSFGASGWTFTLPVTAASGVQIQTMMGTAFLACGGAAYAGMIRPSTTTVGVVEALNAAGTYLGTSSLTSSVPGTWAANTNNWIRGYFIYEAA